MSGRAAAELHSCAKFRQLRRLVQQRHTRRRTFLKVHDDDDDDDDGDDDDDDFKRQRSHLQRTD